MAAGTLSPLTFYTMIDGNGNPIDGCLLYTYESGTSTPASLYLDANLMTAASNPVEADSSGRFPPLYLPSTLAGFKYIYTVAADPAPTPAGPLPTIIKTIDPVGSVPETVVDNTITGTVGEDVSAGATLYLSVGDGSKTPGLWYLADADFSYASSNAADIGIASDDIDNGDEGQIAVVGRATSSTAVIAGTLYYVSASAGALTATPPTNRRLVGVAVSATDIDLTVGSAISQQYAKEQTITSVGTQNNVAVTAAPVLELRADNASSLTVTGFATPVAGMIIDVFAVGAGAVILANQNASSTDVNRIITGLGADLTLTAALGRARLVYDATTARWRVSNFTAATVNLINTGLLFPSVAVPSSDENCLDWYKETLATPWVPADGSGAGLVIVVSSATAIKIGKFVFAQCDITYPATADVTNAQITGLPYTSGSAVYGGTITFTDEATLQQITVTASSVVFVPRTDAGANITNATLSGNRLIAMMFYLASA